jgi:hypothetical protein
MEAAENDVTLDLEFGSVGEGRPRKAAMATCRQSAQSAVPGEGAQAHDDAQLFERADLGRQLGQTIVALLRRWPVGRRCAAIDSADVDVAQREPVLSVDRGRLVGQAGPI